jgi:diacylglycerol kinase (ATP)
VDIINFKAGKNIHMRKKVFLFTSLDFDKKYMGGVSRLYQIFCAEHNFTMEIINENFFKENKPQSKELVVIAGGDGTLHKVINLIDDKFLPYYKFGIIPAGTANEFAKSLNIPYFLEDAAFLIVNKSINNSIFHKIGIVNNKHKFLTGILYGVATQVLQTPTRSAKTVWGGFAYNIPALLALGSFYDYIKHFKIKENEFKTGYLLINNASLISKDLSEKILSRENKNLFSLVYISASITAADIARLLLKNQMHLNILDDSSIFYQQIADFNLEFEHDGLFMLDGETYNFSSPLHIKHHNKELEIIV